jgi:hypothetical protein
MLVIGAFLLVTTLQLSPSVSTVAGCDMEMMGGAGGGSAPAPCPEMTPACIIDLGCTAMASLPAPELPLALPFSWARIAYDRAAESFRGLSIKPDLTPPILIA